MIEGWMYAYILTGLAKNVKTWMYVFDRADFKMLGLSENRCSRRYS